MCGTHLLLIQKSDFIDSTVLCEENQAFLFIKIKRKNKKGIAPNIEMDKMYPEKMFNLNNSIISKK